MTELAERWRAARPKVAGLHLDSAACSRQSFAVIDAAAQHTRHEAEVGGYVAAEAAEPVLQAGPAAPGAPGRLTRGGAGFPTRSEKAPHILLGRRRGGRPPALLPRRDG